MKKWTTILLLALLAALCLAVSCKNDPPRTSMSST